MKDPDTTESPVTILDFIKISSEYLKTKGIETARLDTELLLCKVLDLDRIKLYTRADQPLSLEEKNNFRELLKQRAERKPLAYITGEKEFFGYPFTVNRSVLIPRPETELLVEWIINWAEESSLSWTRHNIVDIGTGSGCIAASLMMELGIPGEFLLTDISEDTLNLARSNLGSLDLLPSKRINFQRQAGFENLPEGHFNIIVSNPPYVSPDEYNHLEPEIIKYEPREALICDDHGTKIIKELLEYGMRYLKSDGILVTEMGNHQKDELYSFAKTRNWHRVDLLKDLAGNDRALVLYKK